MGSSFAQLYCMHNYIIKPRLSFYIPGNWSPTSLVKCLRSHSKGGTELDWRIGFVTVSLQMCLLDHTISLSKIKVHCYVWPLSSLEHYEQARLERKCKGRKCAGLVLSSLQYKLGLSMLPVSLSLYFMVRRKYSIMFYSYLSYCTRTAVALHLVVYFGSLEMDSVLLNCQVRLSLDILGVSWGLFLRLWLLK